MNIFILEGQTDEKLNFDEWIYTSRGYSLCLLNFEIYHINGEKHDNNFIIIIKENLGGPRE